MEQNEEIGPGVDERVVKEIISRLFMARSGTTFDRGGSLRKKFMVSQRTLDLLNPIIVFIGTGFLRYRR